MSFLTSLGNNSFRIAKRYFSDIGKTKIGDLPEPMRKHVQAACLAVEKMDPRMGFVDVKGQEHDSTTRPGTRCVTLGCLKVKPGTEANPQPGSRWGTMHVHSDSSVSYGAKAKKALEVAARAAQAADNE